MQIRRAKPADLDMVLNLYQQLNPSDTPVGDRKKVQQTWSEILNAPRIRFFVLEKDSILVCTCMLSVISNLSRGCAPYGLIENVVTETNYRRLGFATELLKFALDDAWKIGCYKVMLLTGSKRPEILNFYEKAGFILGQKTGLVAYPPPE